MPDVKHALHVYVSLAWHIFFRLPREPVQWNKTLSKRLHTETVGVSRRFYRS